MKKILENSFRLFQKALYKALYCYYRTFSHNKPKLTPEEARLYLESAHPSLQLTVRANNHIDVQVDLMIIIPTYNSEEFINICIESVLMQETKYSYKVVVVNDGSTDGTADILRNHSDNDKLEVIHQENRGQASARNRALEKIIGKYIMFVDADDKLPQYSIENLMNKAFEADAEIVEGNFTTFTAKGKITIYNKHHNTIEADSPLTLQLRGFAWGKVFRAELFSVIKFPIGNKFEDTIMALLIYPLTNNCYTIKDIVYEYFRNPKGITSTVRGTLNMIDTYWVTDFLLKEQDYYRVESNQLTYTRFLKQIVVNHGRIATLKDKKIQECVFVLSREWFKKKYADKSFDSAGNYRALQNAFWKNNFNKYDYLLKGFRLI